jgi:hypothetical protein
VESMLSMSVMFMAATMQTAAVTALPSARTAPPGGDSR